MRVLLQYKLIPLHLKMKIIIPLLLVLLVSIATSASKIDLPDPEKQDVLDDTELVKLAEEEKFVIPLNGRTISHLIQYVPKNSNECQFVEPTITYKSLFQSKDVFNSYDEIASLLVLKTRQIVIVADPYYSISSFSTDRHFLLKKKLPETKLQRKQTTSPVLVSPVLVSTSNQEYIYYLTPASSFVFHYSNVASDIKQFRLQGDPAVIYKAIQRNNYILLCTGLAGILVYRINQTTKQLKLVQQIVPTQFNDMPSDMQLNEQTQLLYVLNSEKTISIYFFNPTINEKDPTQKTQVLEPYDEISLQGVTFKHVLSTNPNERVGNINIQISRGRVDENIMILFEHGTKTVVAELVYHSQKKQFSFVRYYKYSLPIREIHVIQDIMVVVGNGILGMFPFGIHPKLIVEEFNGFMTLTSIQKIMITQAPFFVGVSKNKLEFAGVFLNNQAGINCHLSASSELKQIRFKANLTLCGDLFPLQVHKYCEYEKTFIIKQMQIMASAPVAASLWVATIIFTLLIVVGLCCLFAIQKKKQRQIRKLQLYFQQKKRKLPASSDRVAH